MEENDDERADPAAVRALGQAATCKEAVARAEEIQPDVVLMDLQMPAMNGIDATRRIVQANPSNRSAE